LIHPVTCEVRKNYSTVSFTIHKWVVFKEEGMFRDYAGQVVYDPSEPARSRVEFTVQVASMDTRNGGRDGVLRSEDFFAAQKYPTMTFTSSKVAARPDGSLEVTGDLRIRDVTERITIPVRYLGANSITNVGQLAGFETTFTIDRTDFGVIWMEMERRKTHAQQRSEHPHHHRRGKGGGGEMTRRLDAALPRGHKAQYRNR